MTLTTDELGIWQSLGVVEPTFENFSPFPLTSSNSLDIFRIRASSSCPPYARIFIRQFFGNLPDHRWIPFYPEPGQTKLIRLSIPETLQDRQLIRSFEAKKSGRYLNDDSFTPYLLFLDEFIPFSISQPGLTDQEKQYLDQLLRQYITQSATNQPFPPP